MARDNYSGIIRKAENFGEIASLAVNSNQKTRNIISLLEQMLGLDGKIRIINATQSFTGKAYRLECYTDCVFSSFSNERWLDNEGVQITTLTLPSGNYGLSLDSDTTFTLDAGILAVYTLEW